MNLKLKLALEKNRHEKREPYYVVASRAGISESMLSYFLHGRKEPNQTQKEAIARALNCGVEDIFGEDQQQQATAQAG